MEHGYQQLKEELGLDHFEGRSWRGFHHHAAMTLLGYGFLLSERQRMTEERDRDKAAGQKRVKKGVLQPVLTLPGIRRALQRLLMPLAKPDCTYCRSPHQHPLKE